MIIPILLVLLILSVFVLFWQGSLLIATIIGSPIVYASPKAIRDCLKLARLSRGQTVVDLGCGNARSLILAATEFGAKGIGVDRSYYGYYRSKIDVWLAGQSKNIKIVRGDFRVLESQLAQADVVYLYLLNETLAEIESWLFQHIGPKTVVVSLAFSFPNRQPIKISETQNLGQKTKIRLYRR
jgi:ubiquinone/menaquinone biosynthesis C-methylase UbiE